MREWMNEPDDPRPVIGQCAVCGCDIHDECDGYWADEYYSFEWMGDLVCDEDLRAYCDQHFRKGD